MANEIKKLEEMFRKGLIDRREFIKKSTILGISGALSLSMWGNPARAAAPKRGGRLRIAMKDASTSDAWMPGGGCCSGFEMWFQFSVRNHLVEIDPQGKPVPALAESWDSTPDAKKWVFNLRKGVTFHDGKELTAQDAVYSIKYHLDEKSKSAAKSMLSFLKDVRADGKYQVVFESENGYADMPALLSDYHLQIMPDGYSQWETFMGTGPFIMKEAEPGVRYLGVRNPNYWRTGKPYFDEVESLGINDVTARTAALRSGKIDVMADPDLKTVHLLKNAPGIQVIATPGLRHFTMAMMTDVKPFDDLNVRLALKHCVDREELLSKVLKGYGTLGNDHPIAPIMRYYDGSIPQRKYDPDKAKFYAQKAGLKDTALKLHVADTAYPGAVDTAMLMRESAAKAGVNIEVVREPNDGYWNNVWRKKPWSFCTWSGRATEDMMFSVAYAAGAPWNDAHWEQARFNELLLAARQELDNDKRSKMYSEMQRIVHDEGGTIVHLFTNTVLAASTKVHFEKPLAGHFMMDGQRGMENWWFEG